MSDIAVPQQLLDFIEQEASLLGRRREALMKHGFSREEAMAVILASVPHGGDEIVWRPPKVDP